MNVSRRNSGSAIKIFPIIFTLGFIPLIVHMYQYDAGWENLAWFPNISNAQIDFFLGWKSIAIVLISIVMLGILFYHGKHNKYKFRIEPSFLFLLVYGLFAVMSAIFSSYKPQVFTGSYEVLQPVEVILGYLLICFYTYQFADNGDQILRILRFSGIGFALMLIIGFFQWIGYDLLATKIGKGIISNPDWWDKLDQINFAFGKHTVYATLYNPDFLSFYFGLMIPVLFALFWVAKKSISKILLLLAVIFSIICIVGAGASSGYISVAIACVVGIYLLLSRKRKTWIAANIAIAAGIILLILLCTTTQAGSHVQNLFLGTQRSSEQHMLQSLETMDSGINLKINHRNLTISYVFDQDTTSVTVFFEDEEGNFLSSEIVPTDTGSAYVVSDSSYGTCQVEPVYIENTLCIKVSIEGKDWYFTNQKDNTYYYYNPIGKYEKIAPVKKSTLFKDDAMSGRGNIWNLTIPQLPSHIFVGSGANSFARVLPQNDYVYKVYNGLDNVFAVKAHNWFLQEWVENGLIGTLCLFAFYLWYFIKSVRIYHSCSLNSATSRIGFGIFIGTIGYMAAGVANDANVTTAPVFWVAMGLGMAANRMIAEKNEK